MLTPKAITRLQEVKEHILAEPNNLIMRAWSMKQRPERKIIDTVSGKCGYEMYEVELNPPCGTAACIAGWLCLLDPEWERNVAPNGNDACKILQWGHLETAGIPALFLVRRWPVRIQQKFATVDLRERAAAAAEAIDLFIAGDGHFYEV